MLLFMNPKFWLISAGLLLILPACADNTFRKSNKFYRKQAKSFSEIYRKMDLSGSYKNPDQWVGTTNFGIRKPNLVVIHHTAQESCRETLETFTRPDKVVSSHYVICEDGTVYHLLNDYFRGHHAGAGMWGTDTDINSSSIGIELDNNGSESFTEPQMESLETLLAELKNTYKLPAPNFIGHSDLAPSRKVDPSEWFDWKRLADKGFGVWFGDTTGLEVPPAFDHMAGLKVLGYDVRNKPAVISAFKRKYLDARQDTTWVASDNKVLYSLYLKALNGY